MKRTPLLLKNAGALFVAVIMLWSIAPSAAHAIPTFETNELLVGGVVTTSVHSGVTTVNTTLLQVKENILDAVAFSLKEGIIAALTQSIIDWINNGFHGGPSFVTDLRGFLGEVADYTSLDFIEGTDLGFLCTPFSLDIRIALAVQRQPFREHIRCSLGDVTQNAERFLQGDFSQGGWPAWFRVHTQLQNNPYGAYLLASGELDVRLAGRRFEELQFLSFGEGFFSKGKCRLGSVHRAATATTPDTTTKNGCLAAGGAWDIVTPGQQINDQLSRALGAGFEELHLADEINEIVSALIAQLARQALTSVDGVVGLSSRSSSSSRTYLNSDGRLVQGSYLEALSNETAATSLSTGRSALMGQIETDLKNEKAYAAALKGAATVLGDVDDTTFACYYGPQKVRDLRGQETIQNAADQSALYEERLEEGAGTIAALEDLRDQVAQATTASLLEAASAAYDSFKASTAVHTAADTNILISERDTLGTILTDPTQYCNESVPQ